MTQQARYLPLKCISSKQFLLAVSVGLLVALAYAWIAHTLMQAPWRFWEHWRDMLVLVILYPVVEEISFRGFLQSMLSNQESLQKSFGIITLSNIITTLAFVTIHFIYNPPQKALMIFFPSLVFGYFKDRCHSVIPSIVLHVIYNFLFLLLNRG
jgi:membrane protease YdiL (CAAX protease family)